MKITKKTESVFEIEFDDTEIQSLKDIEDVFLVSPDEVIDRSVSESLRLGVHGIHNLINNLTGRQGD